MVILRSTDRVPVKMGDTTIWISPLSALQRSTITNQVKLKGGQMIENHAELIYLTLKYSVKEVEGISSYEFSDGSPVCIKQDESGELSNEQLEALLYILGGAKLTEIASTLLWGKTDDLLKVEGVEVDFKSVVPSAKKN